MIQLTDKLTHGRARTIEGKLIRDRVEAVLGNPDSRRGTVKQTLAAVGLLNENRGRDPGRWVKSVVNNIDDYLLKRSIPIH
jgi:hypothetical protein